MGSGPEITRREFLGALTALAIPAVVNGQPQKSDGIEEALKQLNSVQSQTPEQIRRDLEDGILFRIDRLSTLVGQVSEADPSRKHEGVFPPPSSKEYAMWEACRNLFPLTEQQFSWNGYQDLLNRLPSYFKYSREERLAIVLEEVECTIGRVKRGVQIPAVYTYCKNEKRSVPFHGRTLEANITYYNDPYEFEGARLGWKGNDLGFFIGEQNHPGKGKIRIWLDKIQDDFQRILDAHRLDEFELQYFSDKELVLKNLKVVIVNEIKKRQFTYTDYGECIVKHEIGHQKIHSLNFYAGTQCQKDNLSATSEAFGYIEMLRDNVFLGLHQLLSAELKGLNDLTHNLGREFVLDNLGDRLAPHAPSLFGDSWREASPTIRGIVALVFLARNSDRTSQGIIEKALNEIEGEIIKGLRSGTLDLYKNVSPNPCETTSPSISGIAVSVLTGVSLATGAALTVLTYFLHDKSRCNLIVRAIRNRLDYLGVDPTSVRIFSEALLDLDPQASTYRIEQVSKLIKLYSTDAQLRRYIADYVAEFCPPEICSKMYEVMEANGEKFYEITGRSRKEILLDYWVRQFWPKGKKKRGT